MPLFHLWIMKGWEVWMPSPGTKRQYITHCRSLSVLLYPTATGTAEPCQALPLVTPSRTRALPQTHGWTHGQMDSSRSAAHRVGQAHGHKAMVGLECDMAQWKKNPYYKIFPNPPTFLLPFGAERLHCALGFAQGRACTGKGGAAHPSA